jgi:hypothetical protein
MSDQVADLLDDAADLIEYGGWIQGALEDRGAHCALGALVDVDLENQHRYLARAALAKQVGLNPDRAGNWLANWNDDPLRTRQEVLDTFRAAAKAERMPPETPAPPGTPDPRGVGVGLAGGDAETRTRPADEGHPPPTGGWTPR